MRVLFVTSEVATVFKLGGLADVSHAFPIALTRKNVHVTIALPYYKKVKLHNKATCLGVLAVSYAGQRELVFVFRSFLGEGKVPLLLFRHPFLDEYQKREITDTFAFFSQAVATFYLQGWYMVGKPYDIVHCHDWHTALVPLLLHETRKGKYVSQQETVQSKQVKSILTLHNLLYQGVADAAVVQKLGLPAASVRLLHRKDGVKVNMLREGIEHADVITTVSPTYAKEALTTTYGEHVDEVLRRRRDHFTGILNGISWERWNPATDQGLMVPYDRHTVAVGKEVNKVRIQKDLHLPLSATVPLLGFVGRLEQRQKGLDILLAAMDDVLSRHIVQFVIMGTGAASAVEAVARIAQKHTKQMVFINTFDERLARRVFASSDVFLVPSKFEPCGLTQMIAMRYGSIPLVRHTGGLADTVTDRKTGFVFEQYSAPALQEKIIEALSVYETQPRQWIAMRERVMKQDFSWDKSAGVYKRLYQQLLKT